MIEGFLVVDKEPAMTSHDVVAIARNALHTKKVGHAGTLDPMATGVLVLGFGAGTRLLQYITDGDKKYSATISLGTSTVTDDKEGEVIATQDASHITDDEIHQQLSKMVGEIFQKPSSVSAVRIAGERAYDLVRAGKEVDIPSRKVTIFDLIVLSIKRSEQTIEIDIDVTCSAGTFIRAIARDLGSALKVGGHLTSLRRTRVGTFTLDEAISIDQLRNARFTPLSLAEVAKMTFLVRELEVGEVEELSFGRPLLPNPLDEIYAALSGDGRLIALLKNGEGKAKPLAVFAVAS